jgi:UDP-N-acetylmuramoylalanine--D-glutamate ligase
VRCADLAGLRVAVWGYGREGRAALTALRSRLPELRIGLLCTPVEAASATKAFGDAVDIFDGEPDAARLREFDVIVKSPGISAYKPALLEAQAAGVRITSGTALWFAEHPQARVIAVTATKGKSTTSALIAHLLRSLGKRTALAGNIGMPLLELLDVAVPPAWWVVELSSFQTAQAGDVDVGVIGNLYEEHLDWHGSREQYVLDKLQLAPRARRLIVNASQLELLQRTATHPDRVMFASVPGWHVEGNRIFRGVQPIFDLDKLPLPGQHNALNACAALAAIEAAGEDAVAGAAHLASFRPLPHRLQTLGSRDGFTWINDSIATTPAATVEALHSLRGRKVCVLLGGFDRGVDWRGFVAAMGDQPPHVAVCMGANGARVAAELQQSGAGFALERASTLAQAVGVARSFTPAGGVILLSPGAPSFDAFRDYAERGRVFAALAGFDPTTIAGIEGLGVA